MFYTFLCFTLFFSKLASKCCAASGTICYGHVIFLIVIVFEYLPGCWQERQRVINDERKKLSQHQAQAKSQMARYEDELARKRMQACIY